MFRRYSILNACYLLIPFKNTECAGRAALHFSSRANSIKMGELFHYLPVKPVHNSGIGALGF